MSGAVLLLPLYASVVWTVTTHLDFPTSPSPLDLLPIVWSFVLAIYKHNNKNSKYYILLVFVRVQLKM